MAIEQADIDKAVDYEILGPGYFAARRIAEGVMLNVDADGPFKEVAKKATELIRDELYDYVETHMLGDLECNIQGHIARMVDDTVQALLTGVPWALQRYALAQRYDQKAVREAVAKHGGEPLLMARIADLEAELTTTKADLERERGYNRSRY